MEKEILAAIGIIITLIGYVAYIYSIFKGDTRPHPFSWFVFANLTAIGFFAQLSDGGGLGAYITGTSALISYVVMVIGYFKRHEITITKSDWVAFISCLMAIPLWMITDSAFWSVILITAIDTLAFYPTFRKAWFEPKSELPFHYIIAGSKFVFGLFALEHFSTITVLYPLSLVITNFLFLAMLYYRRGVIKSHGA